MVFIHILGAIDQDLVEVIIIINEPSFMGSCSSNIYPFKVLFIFQWLTLFLSGRRELTESVF